MAARITFWSGVVAMLALAGCRGSGVDREYSATLTGGSELPPVRTRARAELILEPTGGNVGVRYRLIVKGIGRVTLAHLQMAPKGRHGEVVALLYPRPGDVAPKQKDGPFTGTLAEGVLHADDLVGPLRGHSLDDLLKEVRTGRVYAHLHTAANPEGELRGRVR